METWISVSGKVIDVVKNGDSVSVFLLRSRRRVKVACRIRDHSLPSEYVNQVVRLGARVCATGAIRGSFFHCLFACTPPPGLRERMRLALELFALGVVTGLRANVPGFEGLNPALCRAWFERQRERWASVRRFLK